MPLPGEENQEAIGDVVGPLTSLRVVRVSEGLNVFPHVSKSAAYTATPKDYIIGCDTTSAAFTVTLPKAAAAGIGRVLIVNDEGGNGGTNNITVDGDGSETIDGSATKVISSNYGSLRLYSNGTAWFTF